ncbi:hypothetical protein C4G56_RS18480 [Vibrio parahaemolyticus]|nr:hypothetical protein [Vibrio parahaemolyticus]EHU4956641.1 hypothetical protein [Vibrio parahaemolyticus]EJG0653945.1 hypothetical protein [Vibrio parahaemolyticus]EJG0770993.1 hypothetical protein [Vibrio parahaemolyticus]EJG0803056.1 hypothetical protein [Vibrio parahaemolyticus]
MIIYSLTSRGFYSEFMNLAIASIYCDLTGNELIVNTRAWVGKYDLGLQDYFEIPIKEVNDFYSVEYDIFGLNRSIYIAAKKIKRMDFSGIYVVIKNFVNIFYKKYSGNKLSSDIFFHMRSKEFIESVGNDDVWQVLLSNKIKELHNVNKYVRDYIEKQKEKISISNVDYISVHIRRGDKIATNEMENISISRYVEEIKKRSHISKNVYVATDDYSVIKEVEASLGDSYKVFHSVTSDRSGFSEKDNIESSSEEKRKEMLNLLLDVSILSEGQFFIGTYSSNLSRVIPCFKKLSECKSLDIEWTPVF